MFSLSLFRPSRQSNISTSGEKRFKYHLPWENKISQMPYARANKDNQIPTSCPAFPLRRHNIDRCITSSIIKHGRSSARSAIARSFEMKGSRVLANLVYSWKRCIVRCVIYPPFCWPLPLKEKSCSVLPNTNSWNLLGLAIRPFFLSHCIASLNSWSRLAYKAAWSLSAWYMYSCWSSAYDLKLTREIKYDKSLRKMLKHSGPRRLP